MLQGGGAETSSHCKRWRTRTRGGRRAASTRRPFYGELETGPVAEFGKARDRTGRVARPRLGGAGEGPHAQGATPGRSADRVRDAGRTGRRCSAVRVRDETSSAQQGSAPGRSRPHSSIRSFSGTGGPVVAAGDMNASAESKTVKLLGKAWSFAARGCREKMATYYPPKGAGGDWAASWDPREDSKWSRRRVIEGSRVRPETVLVVWSGWTSREMRNSKLTREVMDLRVVDGRSARPGRGGVVNAWNRNVIPWWLLLPQGVSGAIKRRARLRSRSGELAATGRSRSAVLSSRGRAAAVQGHHPRRRHQPALAGAESARSATRCGTRWTSPSSTASGRSRSR